MKKRFLLFSFVLFFATLCAGLLAHEGKSSSYQDVSFKEHFLQKSNHQDPSEVYAVSDLSDIQDSNDLEKVKFDYSVLEQEWLKHFFAGFSFKASVTAIQSHVHISTPRYILYHSLQVAGC
ncbi:hypothetical protein [Chryseobacterium sp. RU37D]|uniref:hypothetical protein n=1 Tax=Chryseobacterium sp. RU37D TaxID=1907397 RepID=UPI000970DDED|nr:hypothetical protein [Chryseobacterium sp. RU37D]